MAVVWHPTRLTMTLPIMAALDFPRHDKANVGGVRQKHLYISQGHAAKWIVGDAFGEVGT